MVVQRARTDDVPTGARFCAFTIKINAMVAAAGRATGWEWDWYSRIAEPRFPAKPHIPTNQIHSQSILRGRRVVIVRNSPDRFRVAQAGGGRGAPRGAGALAASQADRPERELHP